jgi:hypothetical protein
MTDEGTKLAAAFEAMFGFPATSKPYDQTAEERMAHVANGGTLRAVPVGRSMRPRFRRGVADDVGFVSDDGVHVNRWEPPGGDAA